MNNTFEDVLEQVKSESKDEALVIETAEKLADLVQKITEARIRKGITQRQLAEMSGIKQSAIARFESLQVIPRLDTVIKITNCLGEELDIESERYAEVIQFPYLQNTRSDNYIWRNNYASLDYAISVAR